MKVNTSYRRFAALGLLLTSSFLHAHSDAPAGPNGGRILKSVQPPAEFFVTRERKVQITFVNAAGEPIAPSNQVVSVTTGKRSDPTSLKFSRVGNALLSDRPLPEGNLLPTVVQIQSEPGASPVVERFNVNLAICPDCGHGEYACTCHD